MTLSALIKKLVTDGVLKSENIIRAFENVNRKDFVPPELTSAAYEDTALSIGEGQTISQPYTVVFMMELLQPKNGDRVLEIGYGSGWQTALLAETVGEDGKIYAFERVPILCKFGGKNLLRYPKLSDRVEFFCKDATPGLPDLAKEIGGFDAIIAAAKLKEIPPAWRSQLKTGGRLVYPKQSSIFREIKKTEKDFETEEYPGFMFVPFIQD